MNIGGPIAVAVWLAVAHTGQAVGDSPVFEEVMIAPNDSGENGIFFNYRRGRLFTRCRLAHHRWPPLSQLSNSLSSIVGRTVLDETGLAGNFDVHLTWNADGATPPRSLLTGLREQLGLELVPYNRSAEVLVIDRADRSAVR